MVRKMDAVLRDLQNEVRRLALPGDGGTGIPCLIAWRFTDERIRMPKTENPCVYLVPDGVLRLYTPSGILDYMVGQYSVSKIDTPLSGTVLAFSEQRDFLALSLEFTVHDVITAVLGLDNDLTEKIAGGIGVGGGTAEQDGGERSGEDAGQAVKDWVMSFVNRSFSLLLLAVVLAGSSAIIVLLLLSSFFTRRMNRVVMEPVELLAEGAERIRNGDLSEEIDYQGEEEFEHVCRAFNDMQHTILADREQRARTEQARTDMVTGISHDLRTPLTSVQGYIKGVLDGIADTEEKKRAYLKTAYESTEEMNILLQKLFDFSRMESGQMPFHMVKADLAEYTAAYVAQKEAAYSRDRLQIRLRTGPDLLPEISMDVDQVKRVFDNLLENSLKYARVSPVQVEVSVRKADPHILLEWRDNGKGVPEEKLEKIFERFYRCDEARQEQGSGVGLYVVRYIMERHHGTVKAENDGGLKVSLYFPLSG